MKINTDSEKINEILERGVITEVIPNKEEFKRRLSEEKLRIYIGADPTSTSLHLSHAKNYMLLEEFRKLGHEVVVLFGDFTARIGDPTDQSSARNQLSEEEIKNNVKGWIEQIKPLMDFDAKDNPPLIKYNNDWLSKLSMEDVVDLASNVTVQRMLERDMFEKRTKEEKPIYLHEFIYPLMQGYDSVAMNVDVELCGTDQIFNALVGRTLLKRYKDKEKTVVAVNLMENPSTGELMSKSKGTGVFLNSTPFDMYGSIMSQPDEMIKVLLINNTRIPLDEVEIILQEKNPRDAKMKTALEITRIFCGEEKAKEAKENFENTFSKREIPDEMEEIKTQKGEDLSEVLKQTGVVSSKSDFNRLASEGAIKNLKNEEKIMDSFPVTENVSLKVGKRRFIKILV